MISPRRRRRTLRVLALASSLALLSACGGGSDSDSSGAASSDTLYIAYATVPATIDSQNVQVAGESFAPFTSNLVRYTPLPEGAERVQGPADVECNLCSDYERDEDGSYTFTLRETASPAGNPLTSDDVEWSFDRMLNGPAASAKFYLSFGNIDLEKPITVVDDKTFTLNVTAPSVDTLGVLTFLGAGIVDAKEVKSHATDDDPYAAEWMSTNEATFGAYQVASFDPGTRLVLEQNPNYWAVDDLGYKSLVIQGVADANQRLQLLLKGEVNYVDLLSPQQLATLQDNEKVQALADPNNLAMGMYLNFDIKPFADVRVRKAIQLALDTPALVDSVYQGFATPVQSAVPPSVEVDGAEPTPLAHDLDQAKALLADAGYADGFDFELTITPGLGADMEPLATIIQSQLAEVGITVKINVVAAQPEYVADATEAKYAAWIWKPTPIVADPVTWYQFQYTTDTFQNYQGYSNPKLDALVKSASVLDLDDPARTEDLVAASKIANEDVPMILLAEPANIRVWDNSVTGDLSGAPNLFYGAFWGDHVSPK